MIGVVSTTDMPGYETLNKQIKRAGCQGAGERAYRPALRHRVLEGAD